MLNNINTLGQYLSKNLPEGEFKKQILRIGTNKKRPLGHFNPWAWYIELVRGCNLNCGFCATALLPRNKFEYMSKDTWIALLTLLKEIAPYTRINFCNAGKPSLHPELLEFLKLSRKIVPHVQIQLITNGTTLITGKVKYKELFQAGLNFCFVDMYSPKEKHIALAKQSGYMYYEDEVCDKKILRLYNRWTYYDNPDLHVIVLGNHPGNWPVQNALFVAYVVIYHIGLWSWLKSIGQVPNGLLLNIKIKKQPNNNYCLEINNALRK